MFSKKCWIKSAIFWCDRDLRQKTPGRLIVFQLFLSIAQLIYDKFLSKSHGKHIILISFEDTPEYLFILL